ncbi:MAG: flap endonuclease [Agarilytica sp.]
MQPKLYIIDASIFIFRYYFSMPSNWFASNGRPTETVYGYALWLLKFIERESPNNVVACFDESLGSCFRNDIYPDYKSSRAFPDDDLAFQLLACKKITALLGVPSFASDRYEADDLAGCFAKLCLKQNKPYTVLTRDKDLAQLVYGDLGSLWDYPDKAPLLRGDIIEKHGIRPEQVADYLALVGDTSDDIPGVPSVGAKTAQALLAYYSGWADIKAHLASLHELPIRGAKSLGEKLQQYSEQIDMALKLSQIKTDAVPVKWGDTRVNKVKRDEILELALGLGFPSSFMKKVEALSS